MYQFQQWLKQLKAHIKHWNQTTYGNIFQAQEALAQEIKEVQQTIITGGRMETLTQKY